MNWEGSGEPVRQGEARRGDAKSIFKAAVAYFAAVFAIGFAIGACRVLLLAPRVGETVAVALEAPVMIAVSWLVCAAVLRRFAPPATASARLAIGALALFLLLVADAALGFFGFGRPLSEQLAAFARPAGAIGFAAQCVFGLIPLLTLAERRRPRDP